MSAGRPRYRLFEVVGIELEYPVVDRDLRPRCLVEDAFRLIHGRPASEVEYREAGFSNELAAHVFELKTRIPQRSLARAEHHLLEGLRHVAGVLRDHFDARLLPTGMHPLMRASETRLWPRAGRRIYRTYDRIFGIAGHGWLNVQAMHVNLPFGAEAETVAMHNAIAALLPYLPALSASSPIVEGRIGPALDNRLAFYRTTQRRVPIITGDVIPEYVESYRDYRSRILKRIYRALDRIPGGEVLQHEWVNSRGAIVRFMRDAIEIRTLDTQECVRADIAVAVFVRAALRWMVRAHLAGELHLPPHRLLVQDLDRVIRHGRAAPVVARHLVPGGRRTARRVLEVLLERAAGETPAAERPYLAVVEDRLVRGSLAERITRAVQRRAPRTGRRRRQIIRNIYEELAECLVRNAVWPG